MRRYRRLSPRPFHRIDLSYPRLKLIHECPFIFTVPNFLSGNECDALRTKAAQSLAPQTFDNVGGGQRSSLGAIARNEEVPTLRAKLARLANVAESQLQPLKISRYTCGERFDVHTDAWRGDLLGAPPDRGDLWADVSRGEYGVQGAPISGINRMVTIFVYLTTCAQGGRTRWRWTEYDIHCPSGARLGRKFYESPGPGHGRTDVVNGAGAEVSIRPEAGTAVVHFPAVVAASGGFTDYNAYHESEAAVDEKWVVQQFIWTHGNLDWARVLDAENLEPQKRLSSTTL